MENVRRHRDVNLVTTERRRNYLVSGSNLHTTKFSTEHLLAIEIKKSEALMNKKKKKNRNTGEQTCIFRTSNSRIK